MHRIIKYTELDERIVKNIKDLRTIHGYTIRMMGEKLGIPYTSYSNYENKRARPPLEILIALANIYTISINDLLGNSL